MNRKGQAMLEALMVGLLCFTGLYFILIAGLKIIRTTLINEKIEEQTIATQIL